MPSKSEDNNTIPYEASTHPSLIGVTPAMSLNQNRINDEFLALTNAKLKSSIMPRDIKPAPGYKLPAIVSPYTQLNAILGDIGGFRRGSLVVIVAPKHQYGLGLLNDLYLGHGLVNKPVMIDESNTPVVLNISFCDDVDVYETQMSARYRTLVGDTDDYSFDRLQKFGYKYMSMVFPHPTGLTVAKIIDLVHDIESFDNELHLVTIDDVSLISRVDAMGRELPLCELLSRLRYFFDTRGCTLITNLTADDVKVKQLIEANVTEIPKAISRFGFYGDEGRISHHVDTELVIGFDDGILEMYCGKHRGSLRFEDRTTMSLDSATDSFLFNVPFVE